MATQPQIISNRPNAQKLTSTRSLSMSLGNPADCFMQNKANLLDDQMNLTSLITVDYENKSNWKLGENKPNTNPIKPNLQNAQMNVNKVLTKDYKNKSNCSLAENKPNTNPNKPSFKRDDGFSAYYTRDKL